MMRIVVEALAPPGARLLTQPRKVRQCSRAKELFANQ